MFLSIDLTLMRDDLLVDVLKPQSLKAIEKHCKTNKDYNLYWRRIWIDVASVWDACFIILDPLWHHLLHFFRHRFAAPILKHFWTQYGTQQRPFVQPSSTKKLTFRNTAVHIFPRGDRHWRIAADVGTRLVSICILFGTLLAPLWHLFDTL